MNGKRRRVGIMGGTFDPIHIGHLILGEKAYEQLELEKVLFMPSGNPPHKKDRQGRASDEERTDMVRLAIGNNPHFELSLVEMHEKGYTYTFHTLEMLRKEHPDTDYYFIIGADSLYTFHTWMEPQRICDACTLVVATRNHTSLAELDREIGRVREDFHARVIRLDTMNIDISSQMLREWIGDGKSIRYYLPDPVIQYIDDKQIYRTGKAE
ncbi:MAG: nicotinate-nucleotide adenylyltransferase [Blautia sp.]|nr:nicotinate-nucleotide adenylyltransferase [Blautia sp.]